MKSNYTGKTGFEFVVPIVQQCRNETNTVMKNLYAIGVLNHFKDCVKSTFESKVDETGWHYVVGLGDTFVLDGPHKYNLSLLDLNSQFSVQLFTV